MRRVKIEKLINIKKKITETVLHKQRKNVMGKKQHK